MARLAKAYPAVVSGLLLILAFPPFNVRPLVFLALVPWLASLTKLGVKGSFKSGYVMGFVFLLSQFHWLHVLTARWTGSNGLAIVPYILCCILGSLYFGLAGWLIWICWERRQPLMIPLVWAGVEVFRSYIPVFAFPWGLLPSPLWPYRALIETASFGMIYFTSAWIVLGNTLMAQMLAKRTYSRPGIALFCLLLGASVAISQAPPKGPPFRVTIGQPGVDMAFGNKDLNRAQINRYVASFEGDALRNGARLLVLPEGIFEDGMPIDPRIATLYGGQRGTSTVYQSAFAVENTHVHVVDKTRLVIFGEFVPGRGILPFMEGFKLPSGDLTAGTTVKAVDLAGVRVGPILCFEGLFPDISYKQALNGSQMLAVMSVDDWYMGTGAPEQLRSASVFRAIETGLPLVRSATQGYSLAVDQRGRILAEAPLGQAQSLTVDLNLGFGPTKDVPIKYVFPLVALFCVPVVIAMRILAKMRS